MAVAAPEAQEGEMEEKEGDRVEGLLELYKYLKLYQLRGTVGEKYEVPSKRNLCDTLGGIDQFCSSFRG